MENLNAYQIALQQFDRAAAKLKLEAGLAEVLRHPKRQLTVSIPIRMDDGAVKVFEGFRVKWKPVEDYVRGQGRFRHLFELVRQQETIRAMQAAVDEYWKGAKS